MTHGSIFTGLGGFDLAAAWLGWENIFQCEINPFCQTILKYHFPKTILYDDIKKTDFTKHAGTVDVLSGGFPCQPFSVAGKRKGTADDRFLWAEMLRVIREIQPSWVVAENVYGLVSQERGVVFEMVQADMEAAGYEAQPFVIPACAIGAPHRRDRVWIIANAEGVRQKRRKPSKNTGNGKGKFGRFNRGFGFPDWRNFPTQPPVRGKYDGIPKIMVRNIKSEVYGTISKNYRNEDLFEVRKAFSEEKVWEQIRGLFKIHEKEILFKAMQLFETADVAQGEFSSFGEKASEKLLRKLRKYGEFACTPQGRQYKKQFDRKFANTLPSLSFEVALAARELQEACASFSQWHRRKSIEAYGNAIVPQVAYEIFKNIEKVENLKIAV